MLRAEAVRFELTIPFGMPPFQGGGINHYPTPPSAQYMPITIFAQNVIKYSLWILAIIYDSKGLR